MTDEELERLAADCRISARCLKDENHFETGQGILNAAAAAISALRAERAEMASALDSAHAEVGSNIWRFWSDKARKVAAENARLHETNRLLVKQNGTGTEHESARRPKSVCTGA